MGQVSHLKLGPNPAVEAIVHVLRNWISSDRHCWKGDAESMLQRQDDRQSA